MKLNLINDTDMALLKANSAKNSATDAAQELFDRVGDPNVDEKLDKAITTMFETRKNASLMITRNHNPNETIPPIRG